MSKLLWIVLIVALSAPHVGAQDNRSMPYRTLAAGETSGIKQPLTRVLRDRQSWLSLWRRHAGEKGPVAPAVDFGGHMVIAVFAGETDARQVTIVSITQQPQRLVVFYVLGRQRPSSDGPEVVGASPFHIVRLARTRLPVEFLRMRRFPVVPKP